MSFTAKTLVNGYNEQYYVIIYEEDQNVIAYYDNNINVDELLDLARYIHPKYTLEIYEDGEYELTGIEYKLSTLNSCRELMKIDYTYNLYYIDEGYIRLFGIKNIFDKIIITIRIDTINIDFNECSQIIENELAKYSEYNFRTGYTLNQDIKIALK
jgi:hypothetical protein